jgi:hypothetical protein
MSTLTQILLCFIIKLVTRNLVLITRVEMIILKEIANHFDKSYKKKDFNTFTTITFADHFQSTLIVSFLFEEFKS